jgi:hypothetical protein
VLGNRNLADEQFKNVTLDELSNLKASLILEREERIAEDDEIVQVRVVSSLRGRQRS